MTDSQRPQHLPLSQPSQHPDCDAATRAMSASGADGLPSASGEVPTIVTDNYSAPLPNIPDITIEGTLGRGGMGVVYRGVQTYLDRPVAIKVLEVGAQSAGDQFVERFRREAKLLAQFDHPHIVKCYQAGVMPDNCPYLVMELVDGCSLADHVKRDGPFDEAQALRITAAVATALAHAHDAGMIHRDVKPENILLQFDAPCEGLPFTVKLADLGLARSQASQVSSGSASSALTAAGVILGTPVTMAPEQFDDPDNVDYRSDIYGLGCVLYYALTGRLPFAGKTLTELMVAKASELPPDPSTCSACGVQAADLVKDCLAANKTQRPQSYAAIINRCRPSAATAETIIGSAIGTADRTEDQRKPKWGLLLLLSGIAGGLTAAILAWPDGGSTNGPKNHGTVLNQVGASSNVDSENRVAADQQPITSVAPEVADQGQVSTPVQITADQIPEFGAAHRLWGDQLGDAALVDWELNPPEVWGFFGDQSCLSCSAVNSRARATRDLIATSCEVTGMIEALGITDPSQSEAQLIIHCAEGELRVAVQRFGGTDLFSVRAIAHDQTIPPNTLVNQALVLTEDAKVSVRITIHQGYLWVGEPTGEGLVTNFGAVEAITLSVLQGPVNFYDMRVALLTR